MQRSLRVHPKSPRLGRSSAGSHSAETRAQTLRSGSDYTIGRRSEDFCDPPGEQLRLRWGRPDIHPVFTRGGKVMLPDPCLPPHSIRWLLQGGNQLLVRTRETLLLYQVLFSGKSPALSLLCTFGLERLGAGRVLGTDPGMLLLTTSPYPIYSCSVGSPEG